MGTIRNGDDESVTTTSNHLTFIRPENYRIKADATDFVGGDAMGEFLFDVIIALGITFDVTLGYPALKDVVDKWPNMFEKV